MQTLDPGDPLQAEETWLLNEKMFILKLMKMMRQPKAMEKFREEVAELLLKANREFKDVKENAPALQKTI